MVAYPGLFYLESHRLGGAVRGRDDQIVVTWRPAFGGFGEGESEGDLSAVKQIFGDGQDF